MKPAWKNLSSDYKSDCAPELATAVTQVGRWLGCGDLRLNSMMVYDACTPPLTLDKDLMVKVSSTIDTRYLPHWVTLLVFDGVDHNSRFCVLTVLPPASRSFMGSLVPSSRLFVLKKWYVSPQSGYFEIFEWPAAIVDSLRLTIDYLWLG